MAIMGPSDIIWRTKAMVLQISFKFRAMMLAQPPTDDHADPNFTFVALLLSNSIYRSPF
jgi:hypothetical protein